MVEARKLTPKQAAFVAEYLKDSNGTRAAIVAGYGEKNAKQTAWKLLHKIPAVVDAVAAARTEVQEQAIYNLQAAMDEAEKTIEFARETKNANAMAKAVELRAKLNGLLIDRHDVRQAVGFKIVIHEEYKDDKG